ncbi:unnamed protein product [Spirodela intermedia]|uniref:Uncharacterized protein n=1 Tax=Spirodela intermedia TaxID=51605 RepID=A0A7I8IAJ6_SPIIN|nr:unnamed protein product [Spirodela intermedia]CAA6654052.1 unnamed protein product [Spirodela intermedia]
MTTGGGRHGAEEDPDFDFDLERSSGVVEVSMAVEDPDFDLERAVCSHGLFMMAPNRWDPTTRTFQRPLRLRCSSSSSSPFSSSSASPTRSPGLLSSASSSSERTLSPFPINSPCWRMLRISEADDRAVREFHKVHRVAKERGFGRVFRSPSLFEDMVKCILLCNCQWSRTLSMARALCELQSELKGGSVVKNLQPRTPQKKELRRKNSRQEKASSASSTCGTSENSGDDLHQYPKRQRFDSSINHKPRQLLGITDAEEILSPLLLPEIGDFPSPEELAGLDENFLARRCALGYRAKRIRSLARAVVEKKIQLDELEETCDVSDPSSYEQLNEKLSCLDGFGPFTCANVLMCMGFYHKIPSDSETIRHLRQLCTIRMVDKHVDDIYGEFAPFQFLAYWSELWNFYEQMFGKTSEMAQSDYQLITASNMKDQRMIKRQG